MYSKYSVKDLGIGTTTPIKLRLVVDRNRLGSHGVVKKLTEVFLERVARKDKHVILKKDPQQIRKANKENGFRASEDSAKPVTSKNKRVVSHKYPNMVKDKKQKITTDKYFTEFFELFRGSNTIQLSENVPYFTPYRMQAQYKGKQVNQLSSRSNSLRKRSAQPFRAEVRGSNPSSWGLSKWQTFQESLGTSFLQQSGK